jgi:glycosyltransferase involved in cell wall biosynthesis
MAGRISVIIPVFNGGLYLREAVESALAQTFPVHEIIVVDDGSTDNTAAVAQSLPVVYIHQENHGVSTARNVAIARAEGDYLALLDSDDIWLPEKLALQMEALQDPTYGYAWSSIRYFFEPANPRPRWFRMNSQGEDDKSYVPSTWLIRRETWDLVGPFNVSMTHAEDIDWLARANDLGVKPYVMPQMLVLKRIHEHNLTSNIPDVKSGMLRALRESAIRKKQQQRQS